MLSAVSEANLKPAMYNSSLFATHRIHINIHASINAIATTLSSLQPFLFLWSLSTVDMPLVSHGVLIRDPFPFSEALLHCPSILVYNLRLLFSCRQWYIRSGRTIIHLALEGQGH